MTHLIVDNHDYILWKETPSSIELVSTQTGELINVLPQQIQGLPREQRDLRIEPCAVPFPQRDPSFVVELQQRRLAYLRDAQAKKRTDKGPREKRPAGEKKPRKPRTSKLEQMLATALEQRLAQAGIAPENIELMRKMAKGEL